MKIKTFKLLILTVVSMTLLFIGAFFFLLKEGFLISLIGFLVMLIGGFCTAFTAPKFLDGSSPTFGKKSDTKAFQQ